MANETPENPLRKIDEMLREHWNGKGERITGFALEHRGEFSVWQLFENGTYECVCRRVDAETAVKKAKFYTSNVAARHGFTRRVIITDGGDCVNFEWQFGKGVTFPTREGT